jgi:hypothetical protein
MTTDAPIQPHLSVHPLAGLSAEGQVGNWPNLMSSFKETRTLNNA